MSTRVDRRAYLAALCRNIPYNITERVLANPSIESLDNEEAAVSATAHAVQQLAESGADAVGLGDF